jgi:hypothetical protein
MTPLPDSLTATTSRVRQSLVQIAESVIEQVRRDEPEDRATRARREAREFLQQRREAIARAFENRTP